jgi:hypothetical protein
VQIRQEDSDMDAIRIIAVRLRLVVAIVAIVGCVGAFSRAQVKVNVTTWHNDIGRTGQNTNEPTLTTVLVGDKTKFGRICSGSVDGPVYAQPLVVWDATNNRNIVYVATVNDSIYAFNGSDCSLLASNTQLIPTTEAAADCTLVGGGGCPVGPTIGVLGTPVIDPDFNTVYLVTESQYPKTNPTTWYDRIHALNAITLAPRTEYHSPQIISGQTSTGLQFAARTHLQRPGLLLLPNLVTPYKNVYIAFSMIDGDASNPNGWIFGYDALNLTASSYPLIYATTPEQSPVIADRGGIWQGGAGLAAGQDSTSSTNYIYFSTGDGTFDPTNQNFGDSFVKLTVNLQYPTSNYYFASSDQCWRQYKDMDYGSGGTMLIPDGTISGLPYLAVKADKENYLWVMRRDSPGGYSQGQCDNPPPNGCAPNNGQTVNQCLPTSKWHNGNVQALQFAPTDPTGATVARSTPAFWTGNNNLYLQASIWGQLQAYLVSSTCQPGPICPPSYSTNVDPTTVGMGYAATPAISSGPAPNYSDGIVWALRSQVQVNPTTFYAFKASDLSKLYSSRDCKDQNGGFPDQPGPATKFSVPTVANGFVYVGTRTEFDVYGPLSPQRMCYP